MATDTLPAPDPTKDPLKQSTGGLGVDGIIQILNGYRAEAEYGRKGGLNPRDDTWEKNWNLYWGRYDFSQKASWQSKIVMPEAAQVVDRWAAALKDAITQAAAEWYEIEDLSDGNNDLKPHIKKFLEWILGQCGRTPDGHPMAFPAVFEEIVKVASISAAGAAVTWKVDQRKRGYVAIEASDPRAIWLDPKGRNLYRVRRIEIDKHELVAMAKLQDSGGTPLYNLPEIERLAASIDEKARNEKETSSGHGDGGGSSARRPVVLHEFLSTILNNEGDAVSTNSLSVIANDQFLIRGPEENPFWHGRDWMIMAPMIVVPFSVYGRSYMENWSSVATAFVEMTNLILDGVYTTSMNAYAAVPDMLEDPTELDEGVHPNKVFQLQEGSKLSDFMKEIELGELSQSAVTVWQSLKSELREGSLLNEIALGQTPQRSGITATEVSETSQQSSALIKSIAESMEQRVLEQILELAWLTGLQHVDFTDPGVMKALGEETAKMLNSRKEDFRDHPFTIKVRGLSAIIRRGQALRQLLAALSVIASNETLLKTFLERFDATKLLDHLMSLHGVDTTKLELSEREKMVRSIVAQGQQAAGVEAPAGGSTGVSAQLGGGIPA